MAQTATILVTDLARSTETRVQLGEARAEELRRAHDALLGEQASAHGGNVIKGMGDGVIVAFAGTAEALSAAVAMQQALDTYGRRERIALAMRVGVSVGDVTFESDDCFGTPVIEAARLCALAEPGEILVADLVRCNGCACSVWAICSRRGRSVGHPLRRPLTVHPEPPLGTRRLLP